jgi:VanZ family protein
LSAKKITAKMRKLFMFAAFAATAAITYATLTHVGLMYAIFFKLSPLLGHPNVKTYALFEHVIAFSVLGFLFFLAFPNRPLFVGFVITIGAVVLEYLQNFTPDRHASVLDATEKIVGGLLGIIIANVARRLIKRHRGNFATDHNPERLPLGPDRRNHGARSPAKDHLR